jgi:hypothetical protein
MMVFLWIAGFSAVLFAGVSLGGRVLPGERWQMIASVPLGKNPDGTWRALNLTWYGALSALAYTLATAVAIVLLASVGMGLDGLTLMVAGMLGLCIPASRIIARIVEGKPNTLSVGGASFVGIVAAPWVAWAVVVATGAGAVLPALAALSVAYSVGEGVGRLACLSFGCCYGRPVNSLREPWRRIFAGWNIVFSGQTKKAAYAHGLCGQELVPVQIMTAYLYCGAACLGMLFFAAGAFAPAMILPLVVTQVWRVLSEFFRADYRGDRKISAYQIMAGLGAAYGLVPALTLSAGGISPDLGQGMAALWTVPVLLLLQVVFVAAFLSTGRSSVTGSVVRFFVKEGEI